MLWSKYDAVIPT